MLPIFQLRHGRVSRIARWESTEQKLLNVPLALKARLWELLEQSPGGEPTTSPQEAMQDLLRVRQSIAFRVEELRRQKGAP